MPPTSQTAILAAIVPTSASVARITKPTDFDAIQSIPFDDDHNHMTSIASSTAAAAAGSIDGDIVTNDRNAHAGVLKKLTSYFSSSHKTLINLNTNSKNGCNESMSANGNTVATDQCAVFEQCNAVRSSLSSLSSSMSSSAASSVPPTPSTSSSSLAAAATTASVPGTTAQVKSNHGTSVADDAMQPQRMIHAMTNFNSINRNSKNSCSCSRSSSSLSANSMQILCGDKRDVDKCDEILNKNNKITNHNNNNYNHKSGKGLSNKKTDKIDFGGIDGRASATTTATSVAAKARAPNKRVQKIDGNSNVAPATGESFTLPRVVLRQR